MLNQSGIITTKGVSKVDILADSRLMFALPCMVAGSSTSGVVTTEGRKIIPAGTPLAGDITTRTSGAFTTAEGTASAVAGVLIHDVDITAGEDVNGSCLIFGFIYKDKLHTTTTALYTETVMAALNVTLV